jgi:OmpA-OmpF porin, OOP family
MKTYAQLFVCSMLSASLFALSLSKAAAQEPHAYFRVDAGASLVQDTDLKSYFDVPVNGSKVSFDTGFTLGFSAGYAFNRYFSAELGTGFSWNSIRSISGANYADADLIQTPIMASAVFSFPNRTKLLPIIGVGVGGAAITLDVDQISIGSGAGRVDTYGTTSDFVFAYQGFAGVSYEFNPNMSLGLFYRYFGAESPSFKPDYYYNTLGEMKLGRLQTHNVTLAFTWRF